MRLSKFIELLKEKNYDIFVENKNTLPQGKVPDEVEVVNQIGRDPQIKIAGGRIVIE